jgi:hypothetical protein
MVTNERSAGRRLPLEASKAHSYAALLPGVDTDRLLRAWGRQGIYGGGLS